MSDSLVGSDMCISDSTPVVPDELQVARRPVTPAGDGGGGRSGRRLGRAWRRAGLAVRALFEHDRVVLAGLLVLAAALRFIGLETRGRFDGDQGHDVLVLLRLVRDGTLPLLGPPTSIGDFHHGAAYYYLLAPVAWLTNANPTAIVASIATLGVAAVAATWWFARAVGGRVVAAIAALLMVVSPASIEESTFIWNPNPIPLFAALALGSGWRAHAGGSPRWWIPALLSAGMVVQLHVLGIVFLAPILGLAVSDMIGAVRSGEGTRGRAIARDVATGIGLAAILFIPLLVSELQTGFEESRHVLDFLSGGGGGSQSALDPFEQVLITLFRVIGWPLVGLVTNAPVGAIVAVSCVIVLSAWLVIATRGAERTAARWLGLTVLWSSLALTIVAPSLQTVVAGLPNDHYHAYIDPVVFVLVGLGARAIASGSGPHQRVDVAARSIVALALVALIGLDLRLTPPPDPNGGWPAARDAGERIAASAAGTPIDVRGVPIFKTAEGVGFPVIVAGGDVIAIATDVETSGRTLQPGSTLVVACDRIFEDVLHALCGGPAEAAYLRQLTGGAPIPASIDQFDLSPRIVITLYRP
jgi:hypothetical protein